MPVATGLAAIGRRFPRLRAVLVVEPVIAARVPSIPACTGWTAGWAFAGNTSAVDSHAYRTDRRLTVISLSVSRRFPCVRPDKTTRDSDCRRIRRFLCVRAGRCRRAKPVRSGPSIPAGNTEAAEVGVGFLVGQQVPAIPVRTGRTSPQTWPRPPASVDSRAQGDDSRLSKGQPFRPSIPAAQGGQLGDDLERGVTPSIPARTGWRCAVGRACERPSRAHEGRPCAAIEFGAGWPEIPVPTGRTSRPTRSCSA